jgi:hypothetical protein
MASELMPASNRVTCELRVIGCPLNLREDVSMTLLGGAAQGETLQFHVRILNLLRCGNSGLEAARG